MRKSLGCILLFLAVALGFAGCKKEGSKQEFRPEDAPIDAGNLEGKTAFGTSATVREGFVFVEGGTFHMGSIRGDGHGNVAERPMHTVTVKSFIMGKYPVTQKEWIAVMGVNPSYFKGDNRPVEQVSWYDAVEYCNHLSLNEGLTPAYTINGTDVTWNRNANGYRLPTEAEWEYAARGGNGSPENYTYSGSNDAKEVAWYSGNSNGSTRDVGMKKPNSLGLYDMSGNVWEWCWDWYGSYSNSIQHNPTGPSSGSNRIGRGGGWNNSVQFVRPTYRYSSPPAIRGSLLGFRLVRP